MFPVKPITRGHFPKKLITALEECEGPGLHGESVAQGRAAQPWACDAPGGKVKS